jgi:hypothetical protein
MPVVFRERGFRFFFFSFDGSPREPVHIHVKRGLAEAKFWVGDEGRTRLESRLDASRIGDGNAGCGLTAARFRKLGMGISVSPTDVRFDDDVMRVDLSDGRTLGMPLAWYPRLMKGTREQLEAVELSYTGLHWDELDEDLSVAGMLAGLGAHTDRRHAAA